jgi:hypothetical protein
LEKEFKKGGAGTRGKREKPGNRLLTARNRGEVSGETDSRGVRIQGQIGEAVGMRVTVAVSEKSAHEFSRMSTKKNYGRYPAESMQKKWLCIVGDD